MGCERAVALGDGLDRGIDVDIGNIGDETFDLDVVEAADFNFRQNFKRHNIGEIGLEFEGLFDFVLILRQIDPRRAGEAQRIVFDDLAIGVVDGLLHHLGHDRAAVKAAQMRDRHLAGTETLDLRLGLDLVELVLDP